MGGLARGRRFLRLVDRLADAITEPCPLRHADFLDCSHMLIIAREAPKPRR
jgi:hypothetical protein